MTAEFGTILEDAESFTKMWFHVFVWAFLSSVAIHIIASFIAFRSLRKHKYARFSPLFVLISGILTPLTMGLVTSATIAGVYRAAGFTMTPGYAAVYGIGQTVCNLIFSYTRILATL
ncbi:hypothetical protein B4U80_04512 [Leptotrombidium deliense]|uniref:Transmembrane protein 170A-like protein n=1 Tax=Leptotrombidium deliense TaxID=299467 RepID=A0A443SU32_9ACAR|nr:hypothetical protein B4U80_04512 [Leptotrombidium deliense]